MNKTLRNRLAVLLCVALLLCALPLAAIASGSGSKQLYSWTASALAQDTKMFSTNLVSSTDHQVRWNDSGVIYSQQGKQDIAAHSFLNKAGGTYALPKGETLRIDTYPVVKTAGMQAVDLSILYARKLSETALNPADSGLLRVWVSKNGMDWLEGSVAARAAEIVGIGTLGGEEAIFYQIHCENLLSIPGLSAGDYIRGIRIMPDGESGNSAGTVSLCGLTFTGYEGRGEFEAAVPADKAVEQEYVSVDEEGIRKTLMNAAAESKATSGFGMVLDALSAVTKVSGSSVMDLLNAAELKLVGNITGEAADDVKMLFTYLLERDLVTQAHADKLLAEYEVIESTQYLIQKMNTPQTVLRGYADSKAGDILLQSGEGGSEAYMVVKSDPVYLPDGVNVDPHQSTLTYRGLRSEMTKTFHNLYAVEFMVPMTLSVLADGVAPVPAVEAYASFADGVHVAVTSSMAIDRCVISVGGTSVELAPAGATVLICSDAKLTNAVAALADGEYQMTVSVSSGLSGEVLTAVEFEVKDGKAVALGTVAADHSDICPAGAMTDVDKNAWYHEAVDYALTNGIMGGYSADSFGPNDTLSRAMVVQVLYNKEGQPAVSGRHDFTDVPADQWFNNAVTWGTGNGVMGGYGDGKFGPNDSVTVEQVAVILWNYAGNPAFSGNADGVGEYSSWAANALSWAADNDILDGVPFTNATENATRAQTAQMLMNYLTAN